MTADPMNQTKGSSSAASEARGAASAARQVAATPVEEAASAAGTAAEEAARSKAARQLAGLAEKLAAAACSIAGSLEPAPIAVGPAAGRPLVGPHGDLARLGVVEGRPVCAVAAFTPAMMSRAAGGACRCPMRPTRSPLQEYRRWMSSGRRNPWTSRRVRWMARSQFSRCRFPRVEDRCAPC
jgi:hypothetical protein